MTTATAVPVTIDPAAAARVDELDMRGELDQMLEYLKGNVPGLRAIAVELDAEANMWDQATVIIDTHQEEPAPGTYDESYFPWHYYSVDTFSPDVCRHFVRVSTYEQPFQHPDR